MPPRPALAPPPPLLALDGTADELAARIDVLRRGVQAWHEAIADGPPLMAELYGRFRGAWITALLAAVDERERRDAAAAGARATWSMLTRYPDGTTTEAIGDGVSEPVILRDWDVA
jgi:hypothetical protein